MAPTIRPAQRDELAALSALMLRSKAHWGYDAAFVEACRAELTITPQHFVEDEIGVIDRNGAAVAVIWVSIDRRDATLAGMFVDPVAIGFGLGRALFDWGLAAARRRGARRFLIDADPNAAGFYERMGARLIGSSPSGSVAGRVLPAYEVAL